MNPDVQKFGNDLANAAIAKDWDAVHKMLAPWVQAKIAVEGVKKFFEDEYLDILRGVDVHEIHYPKIPYVTGNDMSPLKDLKEKTSFMKEPRPIAAEVTEANFRQWMNVQLQCDDGQQDELEIDFLAEVWLIVVQTDQGFKVGYWSHDAY
ncbi:MAG: hypothetical protein HY077_06100 [Elusimicrobia bacterium]|nr:hypothetical protein [Elusimicrobiota bacterium]